MNAGGNPGVASMNAGTLMAIIDEMIEEGARIKVGKLHAKCVQENNSVKR